MTRLAAENVGVKFDGRTALQGAGLTVGAGDVVGLVGSNGAGKTTLMRVCANLLKPNSGDVLFEDQPLAAMNARTRARALAFLPSGAPCHWPLEVYRLVALGRHPHLGPWESRGPADVAAIETALELADAVEFCGRSVDELSDGERARVMLARALAGQPRLLLADEPVAGLDPLHQLTVMGVLAGMADKGGSVVVTLHDLALAARFCNRVVLLDEGRVKAEGPPADVLSRERLADVFGISAVHGDHEGIPYILPWSAATERNRDDSGA
ncbi:MAG: ABC transporter ATP-binding protein [Alphaproteobacteria bacterium]|nr:ABC transporter ATP-binding protein [Alphaproteobacteria bacterium]